MASDHEKVKHRDSIWRKAQEAVFEKRVPQILHIWHTNGWLSGTQLGDIIRSGHRLHPDDLTFANLELSVSAASQQIHSSFSWELFRRYFLGFLTDGLDGAYARYLKQASAAGAMNDATADRAGEMGMAIMIAEARAGYESPPENLEHNFVIAFQLSTLLKAASEMAGVITSEKGPGNMIQRRINLYLILLNMGQLSKNPGRKSLLKAIDFRSQYLIDQSIHRAHVRTGAILARYPNGYGWDNPKLRKPDSAEAVEAGKFAAVLRLQELAEVDMLEQLNALDPKLQFPSADWLKSAYPYIGERLEEVRPFADKCLAVVRANL